MKSKLIMILSFITVTLYGQDDLYYVPGKQAIKIPKKARTIIIESMVPAAEFLIDYAKRLEEFGFSIEKLDKDMLSIATDYKSYQFSGVATIKVFAYARQNEKASITIGARIDVYGLSGATPYDACYCGFMGDARKNGFMELLNTLENFHYESIRFE